MKVRFGFVSNSSSTSFTCPACGNNFSGWDWDEDPVCNKCGCHIDLCKETFVEFLIRKYDLDRDSEMNDYIMKQHLNADFEIETLDERMENSLGRCGECRYGW